VKDALFHPMPAFRAPCPPLDMHSSLFGRSGPTSAMPRPFFFKVFFRSFCSLSPCPFSVRALARRRAPPLPSKMVCRSIVTGLKTRFLTFFSFLPTVALAYGVVARRAASQLLSRYPHGIHSPRFGSVTRGVIFAWPPTRVRAHKSAFFW